MLETYYCLTKMISYDTCVSTLYLIGCLRESEALHVNSAKDKRLNSHHLENVLLSISQVRLRRLDLLVSVYFPVQFYRVAKEVNKR